MTQKRNFFQGTFVMYENTDQLAVLIELAKDCNLNVEEDSTVPTPGVFGDFDNNGIYRASFRPPEDSSPAMYDNFIRYVESSTAKHPFVGKVIKVKDSVERKFITQHANNCGIEICFHALGYPVYFGFFERYGGWAFVREDVANSVSVDYFYRVRWRSAGNPNGN